jgi:RHS repeat-associated protein
LDLIDDGTDASGNITATFDYTPYGTYAPNGTSAPGPNPNGPGYTGHVNDPGTNLVYMQARYYDPGTGHFLSTDPVRPAAGDAFNFNRYAYTNNNPVVNTDPTERAPGDEDDAYRSAFPVEVTTSGANGRSGTGSASNRGSTSGWQLVLVGFSNGLCNMGIQASCTENDNVSAPVPSNASQGRLVAAGGLIAGATMAVISDGETTGLTAEHMGIIGDVQELRGSISACRS